MRRIILIFSILVLIMLLAGGFYVWQYTQRGDDMKYEKIPLKNITDIPEEKLRLLSGKRIFFGHQSVGSNIVKGLKEISGEAAALSLQFKEAESLEGHDEPVFAHARVGKNTKPRSKVDDFVRMVEEGLKDDVDIAFFKFCYADINSKTDVRPVFDYYVKSMKQLQEKYPGITFIHSTVPYYRKSGGLKGLVKHILNRDHNVGRDRFNRLMRSYYDQRELFDLGLLEATYPDGRRERGDKSAWSLAAIYTDDGGHLNPRGRKMIAVQLLDFLAALVKDESKNEAEEEKVTEEGKTGEGNEGGRDDLP